MRKPILLLLVLTNLLILSPQINAQNARTSVDFGFGTGNFQGPVGLFNVGTSFKCHYLAMHLSTASQSGNVIKNPSKNTKVKYNDRFSDIGLLYGLNSKKNKKIWTYIAAGPSFFVYHDNYVVVGGSETEAKTDKYSGLSAIVQVGLTHPFKNKNAIGFTAFSNFTNEGYTVNGCLTFLFGKFKD